MEIVGVLLSPFWWAWSAVWWVVVHPLIVALATGLVTTSYLAYRHISTGTQPSKRKSAPQVATKQEAVTASILQVVPVHPRNGWELEGVFTGGLRVFSRPFPSLTLSPLQPCLASSVILEFTPKKALSLVLSWKDLPCWMEGVLSSPIPLTTREMSSHGNGSDIIKVLWTRRQEAPVGLVSSAARLGEKCVRLLLELAGNKVKVHSENITRNWHSDEELSYVYSLPCKPSSLSFHWTLLLCFGLREPGLSLVTLIVLPRSGHKEHVASLLTSHLCALREHSQMKALRCYSSHFQAPSHAPNHTLQQNRLLNDVKQVGTDNSRQSSDRQSHGPQTQSTSKKVKKATKMKKPTKLDARHQSLPVLPSQIPTVQTVSPVATSAPLSSDASLTSLDAKYLSLAEGSAQTLVSTYHAAESEGWSTVGTTKNVFIMKKPPVKGGPPVNAVKGVGTIRAPPEFVMRFLKDPSHTLELDDMMKESRIVHKVSSAVHLVHLLYKAVWPTSPRAFSVLSVGGQVDAESWMSCGTSIEDPRIPPEKGYVRGGLVIGGYLIKSCPDNPDICEVMYAAQVDLKGNIPSFVVNKISDSQPMCVHRLRGLVEPLWNAMKNDPQKLKAYEEEFVIDHVFPDTPLAPDAEATPPSPPSPPTPPSPPSQDDDIPLLEEAEEGEEEAAISFDVPNASVDESQEQAHVVVAPSGGSTGYSDDSRSSGERKGFETPTDELEHVNILQTDLSAIERTRSLDSYVIPKRDAGTSNQEQLELWDDISPQETYSLPSHGHTVENGLIVMETLETYTPEEMSSTEEGEWVSGEEGEEGEGEGEEEEEEEEGSVSMEASDEFFIRKRGPSLEAKLPLYPRTASASEELEQSFDSQYQSVTKESLTYPRSGSGDVDFRTMANQTAARVLEEVFHVSTLDLSDPATFTNEVNGWRFAGVEKDVIMMRKKTADSPFMSFIGKGIIELPPHEVYNSIRNPQLRYTYDNMLKELHIVQQVEEGLYVLHLRHETTQCFIRQSRDFCILVSERSEPHKQLLVGTSIDLPACPPKPDVHRGRVLCSGWVVEPHKRLGKVHTEITYLLQVDVGGIPSTLVNFISRRQPLAVAYLREYLMSTSLEISMREAASSSPSPSH